MARIQQSIGILLLCVQFAFAAVPACAETPDEELFELTNQLDDVGNATNRIIVPVPISDPQLGTGLGLGVAWFYQPQGSEIPWTTGVGGFKTSNGGWGVAAFHKMALGGDNFRIKLVLGKGRLNTKYFPASSVNSSSSEYVELSQDASFALAKMTRRIIDNLQAGAMVRYIDMNVKVNDIVGLPPDFELPPDFDQANGTQDVSLATYGPVISYDNTQGSFSPRRGLKIDAEWLFTNGSIQGDINYSKAGINANEYFGLAERSVLALRQSLCAASKQAPFFAQCQFGSDSNLRGYVSGIYRDNASWSAQGELRQQLTRKLGAVVFAGLGGVAKDVGSLPSAEILPSAGAGVRYLVAEDYGVNFRLDFAWGKHSQGVYVSIGEAF